jgi:hypothetical protein
MIAILRTACGCEKATNVPYNFPHQIRVPLYKPISFIAEDLDPSQYNGQIRTFEFYRRSDDGILEYREKLS